MTYRTVITSVGPGFRQAVRQFELRGYFVAGQAFIRHSQSLVINIAVKIALTLEKVNDVFVAPGWPVVLSHNNFSFVAPANYRFVDIF
ncbi:hypothetical protein D3C72_2319430 [compost metagenome]